MGEGDRAGLAGRRHVPGVVRAFRSLAVGGGAGGGGAEPARGGAPRPATSTRRCPGTTSRPGCTATSCGATGRTRWPAWRSRIAAGRRATTAAPAPGWGSSTSWRPPSHRPAGARARARTSARATVSRSSSSAVPPDGSRRLRLRFSKAGKIRFTSHRDVARMWERALRRSRLPVAFSQGFVPHPLVSFGLALPDGLRVPRRVPRAAPGPGRAGCDGPWRTCPGPSARCCPKASRSRPLPLIDEAEGSLQQEVASCDWELEVLGVPGEELGSGSRLCSLLRA